MKHIPVLLEELITCLQLRPGGVVIDATLGLGGHAAAVLAALGPTGKLLGIERSDEGLAAATRNLTAFQRQAVLVHADFRDLAAVAVRHGFQAVTAVYFDLGLASWQLDEGYQGLSHQLDAPLDMRLTAPAHGTPRDVTWTANQELVRTVRTWRFRSAREFINQASVAALEQVLRELGGVRQWRTVAAAIQAARIDRPIERTSELVAVVGSSPRLLGPVFQALRILVNDEYGAIASGLTGAWQVLAPGGTLAVISFHSGEHALVKHLMRHLSGQATIPRQFPSEEEQVRNPRSRSATLRFITKPTQIDSKEGT